MWSLYVPIHVKSWPKVISGKVGVGSNIAQNRLFSPLEVICDHYMSQFMSKVDQKWKCIKLKSVQILLKSVKILPKVKFIQIWLKIISIVPNLTFKGHPVQRSWGQLKDYIHVYDFLYVFHVKFGQNMHHSEDKAH